MKNKREARLRYYEGIREARLEQINTTEESIRKLEEITAKKAEKLMAGLCKQHKQLLSRIDRRIKAERHRQKLERPSRA